MQPDLRFIDECPKTLKRNEGLILKYTVFAVLSCKHPHHCRSSVKSPMSTYSLGESVHVLFLSFVAVSNSAEFATKGCYKAWRKDSCEGRAAVRMVTS